MSQSQSQKTVYMAVYDGFADWEVGYVTAAITNPQFHRAPGTYSLVTVGEDASPVRSMGGLTVLPDRTIETLDLADAAMLILPGAAGWDFATGVDRGRWIEAARRFREAGLPVAAICGATFGLAAAGLLHGVPHTSSALEYLQASGYAGAADYVDTDAVNADGLITAGTTHAVAFAREILDELDAFAVGALEAWTGLYETHAPEHFYALMATTEA